MGRLLVVFILIIMVAGCDKVTSLTRYSSDSPTPTEVNSNTNKEDKVDNKKESVDKKEDLESKKEEDNKSSNDTIVKDESTFKVPQISEEEKIAFLEAINNARADTQDCGSMGVYDPAPALNWSDELYAAAYQHSRDMAINVMVEHEGSGTVTDITATDLNLGRGSKFYERMSHNGYDYAMAAENIAAGAPYNTPQKVVDAWLKSDYHCANLMNPGITDVGMALYKKTDTRYVYYWTQDFGIEH